MTDRKTMPEQAKKTPIYKEARKARPALALVKEITEISFTGNIIPLEWFKHITVKTKSGKTRPHLLAINILADVVYWYKGKKIRDERSGQPKRTEKKFKGELLQRSYGQIANTFGVSKAQARQACKILESLNLIFCHLQTVKTENRTLSNVMFIEPYPSKINQITHENLAGMSQKKDTPSSKISAEGCSKISAEGAAKKQDTYTEITNTETSITKNTNTETVSDGKKSETEHTVPPTVQPESLSPKITIGNFRDMFIQKHKEFSPKSTKAGKETADTKIMPYDDLQCEQRMEELISLARKYDEIISRNSELTLWYKNKGFNVAMPVSITYLTRKKNDIEDAFSSLPQAGSAPLTSAQRDKLGGDDSTVQKIADEAIRRAEDGAREYLANGGLIF